MFVYGIGAVDWGYVLNATLAAAGTLLFLFTLAGLCAWRDRARAVPREFRSCSHVRVIPREGAK